MQIHHKEKEYGCRQLERGSDLSHSKDVREIYQKIIRQQFVILPRTTFGERVFGILETPYQARVDSRRVNTHLPRLFHLGQRLHAYDF